MTTDVTTLNGGNFVLPTDLARFDSQRRVVWVLRNTVDSTQAFVQGLIDVGTASLEDQLEDLMFLVNALDAPPASPAP